jgi:DNA-binding transcriptional LysR family regulator
MAPQIELWMEIRQIRYALAVASERSFTKAANQLNITQSAVSEQIKLLETRIGFDLFRRTSRGIEQTERGRMFLYEAEQVFSDLIKLGDVARRLSGADVETLILGIGSGLAPALVPRLFPRTPFPSNLHLEIKTTPTRLVFDALCEDRIDLGVVVDIGADRVPTGLVGTPLLKLDLALLLPKNHPLAQASNQIEIAMLADEPIIMNELSIGYGQIVHKMFADHGIQPRIRAIVDNVETIKVMVQSGAGIAIIPVGSADDAIQLGLVEQRPIVSATNMTISAYHSRQALSQRKKTLINWLLQPVRKA